MAFTGKYAKVSSMDTVADLLQLVALDSQLSLEVGDHVEGGGGIQSVLGIVH